MSKAKYIKLTTRNNLYLRIRATIGRTHKNLTIVGYEYSSRKWFVSCECGSTSLMRLTKFTNRVTCGCYSNAVVSLIGNVYSRLTVVSRGVTPSSLRYKRAHWICECDCGRYVTVDGKSLKRGLTKSCGCLNAEKTGDGTGIRGASEAFKRDVRESCFDMCMACGSTDEPQCHHLYSRNTHPKLRNNRDNGIVLCKTHHAEFHKKYGYGNNTLDQLSEYLLS